MSVGPHPGRWDGPSPAIDDLGHTAVTSGSSFPVARHAGHAAEDRLALLDLILGEGLRIDAPVISIIRRPTRLGQFLVTGEVALTWQWSHSTPRAAAMRCISARSGRPWSSVRILTFSLGGSGRVSWAEMARGMPGRPKMQQSERSRTMKTFPWRGPGGAVPERCRASYAEGVNARGIPSGWTARASCGLPRTGRGMLVRFS